MKCPKCKENNDKVIDSRPSDYGIRRRRECQDCKERWTTYEVTEDKLASSQDELMGRRIRSALFGIRNDIDHFIGQLKQIKQSPTKQEIEEFKWEGGS
ncbi:MAG TPA: hypothetical protein ENI07_15615 [Desulfobacterales bacterium]|nr:hypothetical protein [Desulfobacterales bacterium]